MFRRIRVARNRNRSRDFRESIIHRASVRSPAYLTRDYPRCLVPSPSPFISASLFMTTSARRRQQRRACRILLSQQRDSGLFVARQILDTGAAVTRRSLRRQSPPRRGSFVSSFADLAENAVASPVALFDNALKFQRRRGATAPRPDFKGDTFPDGRWSWRPPITTGQQTYPWRVTYRARNRSACVQTRAGNRERERGTGTPSVTPEDRR